MDNRVRRGTGAGRQIAKMAIATSLLGGIAAAVWTVPLGGVGTGLALALVAGISFAALTTPVVALLDYAAKRRLRRRFGYVSHELPYSTTLELSVDARAALSLFRQLLPMIGARVVSVDDASGNIVARRGIGFLSLGEELTIGVRESEPRRTKAIVRSRPSVPFTLVDYGRNFANVEILAQLARDSGSQTLTAAPSR